MVKHFLFVHYIANVFCLWILYIDFRMTIDKKLIVAVRRKLFDWRIYCNQTIDGAQGRGGHSGILVAGVCE